HSTPHPFPTRRSSDLDAHGREHPDFDHGYGMEQRADRGGCHHGAGQPIMEWHNAIFGKTENATGIERGNKAMMHVRRDDAGTDIDRKSTRLNSSHLGI